MHETSSKTSDQVPPNGWIGVLGGGQLGRMLAQSAGSLGLRTHIYTDHGNPPAADCAAKTTIGAYTDEEALSTFADSVDIVTFEFENVPAQAIEYLLNKGVKIAPGVKPLSVSQDRLLEKTFVTDIGAKTTEFAAFEGPDDLSSALAEIRRSGDYQNTSFWL